MQAGLAGCHDGAPVEPLVGHISSGHSGGHSGAVGHISITLLGRGKTFLTTLGDRKLPQEGKLFYICDIDR